MNRVSDRIDSSLHATNGPAATEGQIATEGASATLGTTATDGYAEIDGQPWYQIADSQRMPEFFMSPVSSSDHWMFVSSHGALSAGRRNPDLPLFPYYSSDKLSDNADCTGPTTIIRILHGSGRDTNWEPFAKLPDPQQAISRNLYKSFLGDELIFEEVNHAFRLSFRYRWSFGHRFGFVRTCQLTNFSGIPISVSVLDGLQNLMPYGLDQNFQLRFSNLGDAYKKSELVDESGIGLFYLSSIPTDRAEPSEGLRATVVWQTGLKQPNVLLSTDQLDQFRRGESITPESDCCGRRGAYLIETQFELGGEDPSRAQWRIIANVNQDHVNVVNLHRHILASSNMSAEVRQDVGENYQRLLRIVSSADGRQLGADTRRVQRHQSNVLFNVMRGGLPRHGYEISGCDLRSHIRRFNKLAYDRNHEFLEGIGEGVALKSLLQDVGDTGDADLHRIALEYLPFTYSRRHGDPTRPWNAFSIDFLNPDGSENLGYEGNWRDIFQNWETLSLSFPEFCSSMIFRFLNASTADGYNPYRITKDGIDWEVIAPDDPWGNIGYWGDHQIIYLLKLLEWSKRFAPGELDRWLGDQRCVYAQVPYRIRCYEDIRRNPQETIDFDDQLAKEIDHRVARLGEDGKLIPGQQGTPCHVTLAEKLLLPVLVKITNFVPGGGVWLNTQRPEWNDANNALVGNGLSMVTVCYLRRFISFMIGWFSSSELPDSVLISREVTNLLKRVSDALEAHSDLFDDAVSDQQRKDIVDALSTAGSDYREHVYANGLSGDKDDVQLSDCIALLRRCLAMIDHTIRSNRRSDGLYHSYNLITIEDEAYGVKRLQEMLEGQVAVLSSGLLSPEEAAEVLDALRASAIYREDQQSFMLYPDRRLPRFLEKNSLDQESCDQSKLLQQLLANKDTSVVLKDENGGIHFSGDFRNASDLNQALDVLETHPTYTRIAREERELIGDLFEQTFDHCSFTGRSGTFFAYEGLGSIYWHMVSKLCLATIENYIWAKERIEARGSDATDVLKRLHQHYRSIRDGLGLTKTPQQYGAFPSDPYSHTPKGAGVKQPGMTGQVKEDILSRLAELGMRVNDGVLSFDQSLFESSEFLDSESRFVFVDVHEQLVELPLPAGSFAYTICQVPVLYHSAAEPKLSVNFNQQTPVSRDRLSLTEAETASLFARRGEISSIEVHFSFESCS